MILVKRLLLSFAFAASLLLGGAPAVLASPYGCGTYGDGTYQSSTCPATTTTETGGGSSTSSGTKKPTKPPSTSGNEGETPLPTEFPTTTGTETSSSGRSAMTYYIGIGLSLLAILGGLWWFLATWSRRRNQKENLF